MFRISPLELPRPGGREQRINRVDGGKYDAQDKLFLNGKSGKKCPKQSLEVDGKHQPVRCSGCLQKWKETHGKIETRVHQREVA
jgi:hypothetical protein